MFTPDLSSDAVFRPCSRRTFDFFDDIADLNLCMESRWLQNWWAINLCHLSYFPKNQIEEILSEKAQLLQVFEKRTQFAFAVKVEDLTFIIFQGSCTPEDTLIDLNFMPKKHEALSLHRGFAKAFNYIWPQIQEYLKCVDSKKLIFTGHSLGGALALLASEKYECLKAITFGAPRVIFGSQKYLTFYNHFRFVNCSDAVPGLPPAVFGFRHSGKLMFIDSDQQIHQEPKHRFFISKVSASSKYFFRGKGFIKQNAPLKSLVDHAPVNYSKALSRHLLSLGLDN